MLLWYGLGFVERGFRRFTMIGGLPKAYPFMGVPLAAAVASVQLVLVGTRDALSPLAPRGGGRFVGRAVGERRGGSGRGQEGGCGRAERYG